MMSKFYLTNETYFDGINKVKSIDGSTIFTLKGKQLKILNLLITAYPKGRKVEEFVKVLYEPCVFERCKDEVKDMQSLKSNFQHNLSKLKRRFKDATIELNIIEESGIYSIHPKVDSVENDGWKNNYSDTYPEINLIVGKSTENLIRSTLYKMRPGYVKEAHKKTINMVEKSFEKDNVVFLEGMGGIGKSELGKYYGLLKKEEGVYDAVVFAQLNEEKSKDEKKHSIETVINNDGILYIENFNRKEQEKDREYFVRKVEKLKSISTKKSLIILDNYTPDEDLEYLLGGNYHLLITTRESYDNSGFPTVHMEAIQNFTHLKAIFENNIAHHRQDLLDSDEKSLKRIFEALSNHTYAIELVAKSISNTAYTLEEYAEIIAKKFSAIEGTIQVSIFKKERLTPYQIIKELFDLNKLLESERAEDIKEILVFMSAISTRGIEQEILYKWLSPTMISILNSLIDFSWLRRDIVDDEFIISMHPLIKEVVVTELQTKTDNCERIINNLINDDTKHIDFLYHQPLRIKEKYVQVYRSLITAFPYELKSFFLYAKSVRVFISCGEHTTALNLLTNISASMTAEEKESWNYGFVQYKLGNLHTTLFREPQVGMKYYEEAVAIMEQYAVTRDEKIFLALLYRELGTLHCRIYCGSFWSGYNLRSTSKDAEHYFVRGQNLVKELLSLDDTIFNLQIYDATIDVWRAQIAIYKDNNLTLAEELLLEAEATFIKYNYKNPVDKAAIGEMLSKIYQRKKDYKKQIKYLKVASSVFEEYFGKYHRANVERYVELAEAYAKDNNMLLAIDTLVKCKEIAIKTYAETHKIILAIEEKIQEFSNCIYTD